MHSSKEEFNYSITSSAYLLMQQRCFLMNPLVEIFWFLCLFLYFSDIDLAVIGEWETMPLRTIEKCLIDNGIANPSTIKVLEKASVSSPPPTHLSLFAPPPHIWALFFKSRKIPSRRNSSEIRLLILSH